MTCDVWPDDHGPCGDAAAEVLVFVNPLCGGDGRLTVCAAHLAEYTRDQLIRF